MSAIPMSSSSGTGIAGRHVLAALVAFFGVIFAVNGIFLYLALSTHTGLVAVEPYVMGLQYNRRIAADEAQRKLGWSVDTRLVSGEKLIRIVIADQTGAPVRALDASAMLGRPSTAREDRKLTFVERAAGTYEAPIDGLAPGSWILDAEMHRGASDGYRLRRRLWLKP